MGRTDHFEVAFNALLKIEGNYSDHQSDRGGKTKYGITEGVARQSGYTGDMRSLPLEKAKEIYKTNYWQKAGCDKICALSQSIAEEIFDTAVNMGVRTAVTFLQKSLNGLNRQGKDYQDEKEDGVYGSGTHGALGSFLKKRGAQGELVLLRSLNCLQGALYVTLSRDRTQNEDFLFGWLLNRVK